MQKLFLEIKSSFQLVGIRYALLILFEIVLTLGILIFILSFLKGYEKSFLEKIIGSTPHISIQVEELINEEDSDVFISSIKNEFDFVRISRGLSYNGSAELYERRFTEEWKTLKTHVQSPEIMFKGLEYSEDLRSYLDKVLIPFVKAKDKEEEKNTFEQNIHRMFPSQHTQGNDLEDILYISRIVAVPPSIYRELMLLSDTGFIMVSMKEGQKVFGDAFVQSPEGSEFHIVSSLDTPVSSEEIQFLTSHEVVQYVAFGSYNTPKKYNYFEMNISDPLAAIDIKKSLLQSEVLKKYTCNVIAWQDNLSSEIALISSFYILFFSVMAGVGLSIGLLISSLLGITVRRKRRQISVMLALGAPRKYILQLFCIYSTLLGIIGTFLGYFFSLVFSILLWNFKEMDVDNFENMFFMEHIHKKLQDIPQPESIGLFGFSMILCIVFLICLFSSYSPAKQGSMINPIEGLKED